MENIEILIMPDIHGRTFWKDAIEKFPADEYPNIKIIFLGDYLDPYSSLDGIDNEQAFNNFEEILVKAREDKRIQLLIGNHDWHYFVSLDTCRMDFARERQIERLFRDNIELFSLVKIYEINGCKHMFTHAGISVGWIYDIENLADNELLNWKTSQDYPVKEEDDRWIWLKKVSKLSETHDFEILNECLKNYDTTFYSCVPSMISRERGGWNPHGSMIWADVHEHLYSEDLPGFYQVFGHTISFPGGDPKAYAISPMGHNWAMLDASQAFVLDSKGNIESI